MDAGAPLRIDGATSLPGSLSGLRVALVHDWLTGMRGGEKCLEVLCRAFPNASLFTLLHRPGSVSPAIESLTIRTSPLQRLPGVFRHYRKLLPIMPAACATWDVGDADLVISLSHCVAKGVRVPRGVPHVSYCFTPMRYAWDGRAAYLESLDARPLRKFLAGLMLDRMRAWDRQSASGVTHFVAISETVRGRIAACYGRESRVIEPPVDTAFYTPAPVPRDGPYLCVSALVPYKKIDQAVRACRESGRDLTVIGKGPDLARLRGMGGPRVRFLCWQSDEVIRDHYRRCRALLFPGEEDFGIVPAEAMACGAPVIALNRGGAAETVTPEVGALYDDPTAAGLLAAMNAWEFEGCPHDPLAARRRSESYALPRFRQRLLSHLAEIVPASSHPRHPAPHVVPRRDDPAGLAPRRGRGRR